MLLKLSLLLSTIGIIACNVPFDTTKEVKYEETNQIHQRNYQHSEYLNSYTEVVYKYESNEVNSIDDLVVGNIYSLSFNQVPPSNIISDGYIDFYILSGSIFINSNDALYLDEINSYISTFSYNTYTINSSDSFIVCTSDYEDSYYTVSIDELIFTSNDLVIQILDYGFYDVELDIEFNYFSYTDYNEIESVIYHQPQTIIGYFNEFLEENLFSEIPYVREMSFNIGGQNINLLTYLIIAFGLIVSVGILIGLFLLLRWLFKIFANCFIMR